MFLRCDNNSFLYCGKVTRVVTPHTNQDGVDFANVSACHNNPATCGLSRTNTQEYAPLVKALDEYKRAKAKVSFR